MGRRSLVELGFKMMSRGRGRRKERVGEGGMDMGKLAGKMENDSEGNRTYSTMVGGWDLMGH